MDKKIITGLVQIEKDSIFQFEKYFESNDKPKSMTDLGFGWKVWSSTKPGGYISISSNFYYFKDSLVSFVIYGNLPEEKIRKRKYLRWYNGFFSKRKDSSLAPFSFNLKTVVSPLTIIDDSLKDIHLAPPFNSLMFPTSSLYYYWSGGYSGQMPENRKLFLENQNTLNFDELMYMSYSINPVTRFLAIEEIIRQNYIETKCTNKELEWFERCFNEIPKIHTLNGCLAGMMNSRNLVYLFSAQHYP